MKKPNVTKMAKTLSMTVTKHSPEILTGIGIAGMITTVVMAVKATQKALLLIEEKKGEEDTDILKPVEVIQVAWKPYIPAAITGVVSVACLVGASSVNAKRNAVLATAYSLSETALSEYKDKVVEVVGEKKEQTIRDEIAKDHIQKDPVTNHEVIITEKGNTLCYDRIAGRYFKSDIEKIRQAENYLNKRMMSEMYVSLNEFYYELGLRCTDLGNELGWNINDGFIDIDFSSQLTEDGDPCLVISYRIAPRYDFGKLS